MEGQRRVVWFSCGSASAVAAKLAVKRYPSCEIVYCDTGGEHPSNVQFLKDIEGWIGKKITILRNPKYENHFDVFRQSKFIKSPYGLPCTNKLKKELRVKYQQPDDIHIFGYTIEEQQRANSFDTRNQELTEWILIDNKVHKEDTLSLLWKAGIKIPAMYELGYGHNNCIGCPQGGAGYWNKIRIDFSMAFSTMSIIERELNYHVCNVFLDELNPNAGNFTIEPNISCGISCYDLLTNLKGDHENHNT